MEPYTSFRMQTFRMTSRACAGSKAAKVESTWYDVSASSSPPPSVVFPFLATRPLARPARVCLRSLEFAVSRELERGQIKRWPGKRGNEGEVI